LESGHLDPKRWIPEGISALIRMKYNIKPHQRGEVYKILKVQENNWLTDGKIAAGYR
jgi:hypothetical protein